jgi:hypothetical protein
LFLDILSWQTKLENIVYITEPLFLWLNNFSHLL